MVQNAYNFGFPLMIKIKEKGITLQNSSQTVKIRWKLEGWFGKGLSPSVAEFLVVAQENSDKYLATIRLENSNFTDLLIPKYQSHANVDRGPINPLEVAPKRPQRSVGVPSR